MKRQAGIFGALALTMVGTMFAQEGAVPKGVPRLDHVFIIMMENHGYNQLINNPNAPFIDKYAKTANLATNYFAIAHPSLTNYLEVVGGSNFGVQTDNAPDWHDTACSTNLALGVVATDNPPSPNICPISGTGTDAATPAIDCTNEVQCAAGSNDGENNIDGVISIPAATNISGKTIADQLVAAGLSWKSYQESLPLSGPDLVNNSDGEYTNNTDFSTIMPTLNPPLSQSDLVALYAVKHNPFVYFTSVQANPTGKNSLKNVAPFDGKRGLYADLASGELPHYAFIAPNQCNDEHGRGNAGAFCQFDPNDDGMQDGLNPALIYLGDIATQRIVTAIHGSPAWKKGRSAIVLLWDEDDYSVAPTINKVVFVVDTNYGPHGVKSNQFYTHFSLLKTIEGAFGLPCLNHACDANVNAITDLFAAH
jgi:phosphatidylinositol-3-phosphatase